MVYQGSKGQIKDWLVPKLQKIIDVEGITQYWEPFVGGANVITDVKCLHRLGTDKNRYLIALLEKARDDFDAIPTSIDFEIYDRARALYKAGLFDNDMPDWLIGAIGFLGSFNGRGFAGGYAKPSPSKNYYTSTRNSLARQAPALQGIQFHALEYYQHTPLPGTLIYCDPPYANTKPYGYASERFTNYEAYWNWVRKMSETCYVICSEEEFPDDFIVIATIDKRRTIDAKNKIVKQEKLGVWKDGLLGQLAQEVDFFRKM